MNLNSSNIMRNNINNSTNKSILKNGDKSKLKENESFSFWSCCIKREKGNTINNSHILSELDNDEAYVKSKNINSSYSNFGVYDNIQNAMKSSQRHSMTSRVQEPKGDEPLDESFRKIKEM